MKFFLSFLALLIGVLVAMQSQINGTLGKKIGIVEASLVSFSIGTFVLFFVVLLFGKGDVFLASTVPKWQLIGGVLGATFVSISAFVVPKIGVANTLLAVIIGQISISSAIDHFGLFGAQQIPFNQKRAIAMILLFIALYLFRQK